MMLTPFKLHVLLGLILMASGSILMVIGGYWEGRVGPIFKMEPPCYVLGIGLTALLIGIALKIYVLW